MVSNMPKIGRLAMRQEGMWWNAYYAMPESMVDAVPLGYGPQAAPEIERAGNG